MSARAAVLLAAAAAAALVLGGCSDAEPIDPVDGGTQPPPPSDAGPPDAGPIHRTVTTRSPFGGTPENLFVDGDFEWTVSGGVSQFGWLTVTSDGTALLVSRIETGGLCKSGLRCTLITKDTIMLLRGASASGGRSMRVSIALKPPEKKGCAAVRVLTLPCDTMSAPLAVLTPSLAAGADGWCRSAGTIPGAGSSTCLYLDASGLDDGEVTLVDDAVMMPIDDAPAPEPASLFVPDAALEAKLVNLRATLERHRQMAPPPAKPRVPKP